MTDHMMGWVRLKQMAANPGVVPLGMTDHKKGLVRLGENSQNSHMSIMFSKNQIIQ
jgi:hypothetical protein